MDTVCDPNFSEGSGQAEYGQIGFLASGLPGVSDGAALREGKQLPQKIT